MPVSPEFMRACLLICLCGMALVSALYLRERRLSVAAYLGWGLVILLVPLIGPFLVILARPGSR